MSSLVLAAEALADLEEIWQYIADDSPDAADRIVDEILEACDKLRSSPEIGRPREDLGTGLRSWPVRNYIIFYRFGGDTVGVARVLHGARDIETVMCP